MSPSGLDVRVLDELATDYDSDLADTLVELYLAELPHRVASIVLGASGSGEVLREAAHALSSTSLTVGARRLGELCLELERGWQDPAVARRLVPEVVAESDVVERELGSRYAGSNR
jgi:HPt (histidine-containing phosphotransfer) domain-containing protein